MISETAGAHTHTHDRQRTWTRATGRLAGLLASFVVLGILGLILVTVASRLWGYQTYVIYGSSMEPTINIGSLVITKTAKAADLQVADIIVYPSPGNGTIVTHRIVGVREENGLRYFQTKGDASNGADPGEVTLEGGTQQVTYHLPYLGYLVDFAKSPLAIVLLVVLPTLALLALQLTNGREAAARGREATGEG